MSTLTTRRNAALRNLQDNGGRWAFTYRWTVHPRRNDADYLGGSIEEFVRNVSRTMTADEAAESFGSWG